MSPTIRFSGAMWLFSCEIMELMKISNPVMDFSSQRFLQRPYGNWHACYKYWLVLIPPDSACRSKMIMQADRYPPPPGMTGQSASTSHALCVRCHQEYWYERSFPTYNALMPAWAVNEKNQRGLSTVTMAKWGRKRGGRGGPNKGHFSLFTNVKPNQNVCKKELLMLLHFIGGERITTECCQHQWEILSEC